MTTKEIIDLLNKDKAELIEFIKQNYSEFRKSLIDLIEYLNNQNHQCAIIDKKLKDVKEDKSRFIFGLTNLLQNCTEKKVKLVDEYDELEEETYTERKLNDKESK